MIVAERATDKPQTQQESMPKSDPRCANSTAHILQLIRGLVYQLRLIVEHLGHAKDALLRLLPFALLDRFAYRGQGLYRVSGVCARRIDLMPEPWTLWQPVFVQERSFAAEQKLIQLL